MRNIITLEDLGDWIDSFVLKLWNARLLVQQRCCFLLLNRGVRLTPWNLKPKHNQAIKRSCWLASAVACDIPAASAKRSRSGIDTVLSTVWQASPPHMTLVWFSDSDRLTSNAPCSCDVDPNTFVPQQFGNIEIPGAYAELWVRLFKIKYPGGHLAL